MATKDLDRIDRKILEILPADGRITNRELSERIALSPRACLDRVRRLERAGLIAGYMAVLDPRKLGGLLTIVVEVTLKDQTQATHSRFEQRMRLAEEVVECFLVSGPCDYVLRLEELAGAHVSCIGVGPGRDQTIVRRDVLAAHS